MGLNGVESSGRYVHVPCVDRVRNWLGRIVKNTRYVCTDLGATEELLKVTYCFSRFIQLLRTGSTQMSKLRSLIQGKLLPAIDLTQIVGSAWYVVNPKKGGLLSDVREKSPFKIGFKAASTVVNVACVLRAIEGLASITLVKPELYPYLPVATAAAWLCSLGTAAATIGKRYAIHKAVSSANNLKTFMSQPRLWVGPALLAAKRISWLAVLTFGAAMSLPALVTLSALAAAFGLAHCLFNFNAPYEKEKAA